jgi:hypothetical protein
MATDFIGRKIQPGNLICYPVRHGSKMWLNKLEVQHVDDKFVSGYNNLGHRIKIKNLSNCVIVQPLEEYQLD